MIRQESVAILAIIDGILVYLAIRRFGSGWVEERIKVALFFGFIFGVLAIISSNA